MRHVIGVIGHVDHGKSALVHALTGMQTDRLEEERRRGISIALGFAHLSLPGIELDLIDMPGHERFVRTMISGATGIDAVLLVVAANEGIKPQTVEHLDIAGLLGIRGVIVVFIKTDLVASARVDAVAREAALLARRAGLSVCAELAVSVVTGAGIEALRDALATALPPVADPWSDGLPFLPIDRVFSIPGHGTVVTGTLRGGRLAVSDEIEIAPSGPAIRLRGLQVHGAPVSVAQPGQRVAANLRDVSPTQIRRGAALAGCGQLSASAWLSVELRVVEGAPPLHTGARLNFLFGTEEVEARLRLLDRDDAAPGDKVLAQINCAVAVAAPAREHFILRRPSPPMTVAGGRILDPVARRLRRNAPAILARLAAIAEATPARIVEQEVRAAGATGVELASLARLAGVAPARVVRDLGDVARIVGRHRIVVARADFDAVADRIVAAITANDDAQGDGFRRDRIAAWLPMVGPELLDEALAELVRKGALRQVGGQWRLPRDDRDQARAAQEAAAARQLAELLRLGGLTPPDPAVAAPGPHTRRLVDRLVREGIAIRAGDRSQKREMLFHRDAVEQAKHLLAPLLAEPPGLLVSEAGAKLGISRRFSVPLLEYLDSIKFTRRIEERRVLARR